MNRSTLHLMNPGRRVIGSLLLGAMIVLGWPAAGEAGFASGTVRRIFTRDDGLVLVLLNGPHYAKPACAIGGDHFAIKNEKTLAGKQQYTLLLSAYLSGQTVWIDGGAGVPTPSGTCTRWPDLEDIGYAIICTPGDCN